MRFLILMVCVVLIGLSVTPASAQRHPTVTLDGAQLDLVQRGLEAYDQGNWDKASAFFRAAIELGEANLPIMNLGRTQQRAGNCFAAAKTFDWAAEAPAVREPSRAVVLKTINRYRSELEDGCPGRFELKCGYTDATISVDGQLAACGEFLQLAPGTYTVVASMDEQQITVEATAEAARTTTVTIDFPPVLVGPGVGEERPVQGGAKDPADNAPPGQVNTAAWVFTGVSVALLATGGGLFIYSESLIQEASETSDPTAWEGIRTDWENSRTAGFVALGGGGLAAALALYFAFTGGEEEEPRGATLLVTPQGVSFTTNW